MFNECYNLCDAKSFNRKYFPVLLLLNAVGMSIIQKYNFAPMQDNNKKGTSRILLQTLHL